MSQCTSLIISVDNDNFLSPPDFSFSLSLTLSVCLSLSICATQVVATTGPKKVAAKPKEDSSYKDFVKEMHY